jgi:superfamily I DNA and RNA helicase
MMRGWGSRYDSNSGVYTYICNELGLSFYNYSENNNFDDVCSMALTEMESIFGSLDNIPKLFDYILIDESQDFSESFFKLCEVVTYESIIMAGDTFQTIVGEVPEVISTDYVLNRCYRTDNRTLMFSHAVGLGLFEDTKINWFKDEEWELFGYRILKKEKKDEVNLHQYTFTREPIHRIETNSVGNKNKFAEIINSFNDSLMDDIIKVIDEIRTNNSTVEARDIGIIFIQPNKFTYNFIDRLSVEINIKYKWNTIKGYETKDTEANSLFITNDYNIKGLEFPFIICVLTNRITNNVKARNTLYMGMTRSFISSILILKNEESLAETWEKGLEQISSTNSLIVDEPDSDHIIGEITIIQSLESDNRTLDKVCDEIFDNLFIPINKQANLKQQAVIALLGDDWTEEKVSNIIQINWKMMTDD